MKKRTVVDLIAGRVSRAIARRGTVMAPLVGFSAILVPGIVSMIYLDAPTWIMVVFVGVFVTLFLCFMVTYMLLIFKNLDALRSEQYLLYDKLIERGLMGDDASGLRKLEGEPRLVGALPNDEEGDNDR